MPVLKCWYMKNHVVIYKSAPENVNQIIDILCRNKIKPVILDNPNSISLWASKGTYRVKIAVPENKKIEALSIISRDLKITEQRVKELARVANKDLIKVFLIFCLICLFFYIFSDEWEVINFAWSFILTIILLAIIRLRN